MPSQPPASETMLGLFARFDDLRESAVLADEEVRRASEEEARAEVDYEFAYATAFRAASGAVKERECTARVSTIEAFRRHKDSIALRRSAVAAAKTKHHAFDALAALAHLANREIKAGA